MKQQELHYPSQMNPTSPVLKNSAKSVPITFPNCANNGYASLKNGITVAKNIIAIGAGICDGFSFGDNAKAAFMTRGLAEISRLGVAAGGELMTLAGLAFMALTLSCDKKTLDGGCGFIDDSIRVCTTRNGLHRPTIVPNRHGWETSRNCPPSHFYKAGTFLFVFNSSFSNLSAKHGIRIWV